MKLGTTMNELVLKLDKQRATKKDFIVSPSRLSLHTNRVEDVSRMSLLLEEENAVPEMPFYVRPSFHSQISAHLEVPKKYYDRMLRDAPDLLAKNVNHWFREDPNLRMVRTLGGQARAYLSSSYRRLDNWDVMETTMREATDSKAQLVSSQVTDSKLYLKFEMPGMQQEVRQGEVVSWGFTIQNSEIGIGSLKAAAFVKILACSNGMTIDHTFRRSHLGRKNDIEGLLPYQLSDETQAADDKAIWLKLRDSIRHILSPGMFDEEVNKMKLAAGDAITAPISQVIELSQSRLGLTAGEGQSVMEHLLKGSDLSRWGLANAITRTAEDSETYDRASELESIGGQLMSTSAQDWNALASLN